MFYPKSQYYSKVRCTKSSRNDKMCKAAQLQRNAPSSILTAEFVVYVGGKLMNWCKFVADPKTVFTNVTKHALSTLLELIMFYHLSFLPDPLLTFLGNKGNRNG